MDDRGHSTPRYRHKEKQKQSAKTGLDRQHAVIIFVGDEVIVIADKTTEDTLRLYETLLEYVNKE